MPTILERIEKQFEHLSPGQKRVAHYIQTHLQDVMLLTAHKIAAQAGVSEATVHRLAQALGYPGFSVMHKDLQHHVLKDRAVIKLIHSTHEFQESWLEEHFVQEMENLKQTLEQTDKRQIRLAAEWLLEAENIWVAGWRMGLSVTSFMAFVLKYMLGRCELIPQGSAAEYAAYIREKDVLLVSGFPRYCAKTLKVAKTAKKHRAKVIVLTDSPLSPFLKYGDVTLLAHVGSTGFLDSYTAPLSVCNAIIKEISYQAKGRVKENVRKMEEMFDEFQDTFEWMKRSKEAEEVE